MYNLLGQKQCSMMKTFLQRNFSQAIDPSHTFLDIFQRLQSYNPHDQSLSMYEHHSWVFFSMDFGGFSAEGICLTVLWQGETFCLIGWLDVEALRKQRSLKLPPLYHASRWYWIIWLLRWFPDWAHSIGRLYWSTEVPLKQSGRQRVKVTFVICGIGTSSQSLS